MNKYEVYKSKYVPESHPSSLRLVIDGAVFQINAKHGSSFHYFELEKSYGFKKIMEFYE